MPTLIVETPNGVKYYHAPRSKWDKVEGGYSSRRWNKNDIEHFILTALRKYITTMDDLKPILDDKGNILEEPKCTLQNRKAWLAALNSGGHAS